jgi:hypothetical protein
MIILPVYHNFDEVGSTDGILEYGRIHCQFSNLVEPKVPKQVLSQRAHHRAFWCGPTPGKKGETLRSPHLAAASGGRFQILHRPVDDALNDPPDVLGFSYLHLLTIDA